MTEIMLANRRGLPEARQWVFNECADAEDRLTGELVKRYGYAKATQAMQRAKQSVTRELERRYADASKPPPSPPGLFERTSQGWQVIKQPDQCLAVLARDFPDNTLVVLQLKPATAAFAIVWDGGTQPRGAHKMTGTTSVHVIAEDGNNVRSAVGVIPFQMKYEKKAGGGEKSTIATPLSETLLSGLRNAASVEGHWEVPNYVPGFFRVDIGGLDEAWQSIQRCRSSG